MRLTKNQQHILLQQAIQHFGSDVRLWVFGSRVDDTKRGGDFDVYLETSIQNAKELFQKRLNMQVALHDTPEFEGEKIDLAIHNHLSELSSIDKHALQQGVRLL